MWIVSEWSTQHHYFIAERRFGFGIAAVESVGPDQRGWLHGHPLVIAWSQRDTFNRDVFFQRQAGYFVFHLAAQVPDFYLAGKVALRQDVGIRTVDTAYQQVFAVRRRIHAGKDSRLAHRRDYAILDQSKLRCSVVVKEVFVVGILQQVFKRADGTALTVAFLNDWSLRRLRFSRRIASGCGHGLYQQGFTVGHPLYVVAKDGANFDFRNSSCGVGANLSNP